MEKIYQEDINYSIQFTITESTLFGLLPFS